MPCLTCLGTWLVGLATLLAAVYAFFQHRFSYWRSRNVPQTSPIFPWGDAKGIGSSRSLFQVIQTIYRTPTQGKLIGGWMLSTPVVVLRDLDLIKTVLIKDFNYFHDRGFVANIKFDPLTGHLFFLSGKQWRDMRIKLTPTFTSGKMKMMFPTLIQCGEGLKKALRQPAAEGRTVEIKDYLASFTTEVIASCAFGLEINAFENPNSEFRRMSDFLFRPTITQTMSQILQFTFPHLIKVLRTKLVPQKVEEFFLTAVEDTMRQRDQNGIHRNDFMQLLIQLKNKGQIDDLEVYSHGELEQGADYDRTFTLKQAAAQAFVFFIAGFEPASTAMQFCLYQLVMNQGIQDRLRDEMDRVIAKHGGKITYEAIQEMEYLDMVVSETLRMYPTAPTILRECTKTYTVPDTDMVVEKGIKLFISVMGIHHNPEYYPKPEVFDPERFTAAARKERPPFTYIPFGEGPRQCIGMRFALMQAKAGLTILLSNYKVTASEKTPAQLVLNPKTFLTTIKGALYLKVENR